MEIPAGGRRPAPHLSAPAAGGRFRCLLQGSPDCIWKNMFSAERKQCSTFFPALRLFCPPDGQMIHINYCFPAGFFLTFQRCTLVEPVERYERTRSLPTHSSKQESDSASIRPGLPARRSIQLQERSRRHAAAPSLHPHR